MKILIIKPSSLGDVIHALPFLNAVKETFPDSRIDWVISSSLRGILEDNPLIENLISLNKDSWKSVKKIPETVSELSSLRRTLKSGQYDIVVDLQGLLRSGLIAFAAPAALKVGFADSREGSRFFYDKKVTVNKNLHAADKCLEVARAIGANAGSVRFPLKISRNSKDKVKRLLGSVNEYIVIVPSARWASKRWPAGSFASLISEVPAPCVITGGKGDNIIAEKIIESLTNKSLHAGSSSTINEHTEKEKARHSERLINLCGKTDLKELAALMAGAKAVVSNDSGPMHIAAALGRPTIALFGPTDPEKTGPYGWHTNDNLTVIQAQAPCRPCRRRSCDELICMESITVSTVLKALKGYL